MSTPANNRPKDLDKRIDATLRVFAHAQPPAGLEQRIHTRLQYKSAQMHASLPARLGYFFIRQRIALASAALVLACIAIVMISVQHSRLLHGLPATGVHLAAPAGGLGAASSTHIAPQPVLAPNHGRARSERKAANGRATVSRNAHKPKGVGVPDSAVTESTDPEKP